MLFKTCKKLHRHQKICIGVTKKDFKGGIYRPETKLEDEGIVVDEEDRYHPYRITYDFEAYLDRQNLPSDTEKLQSDSKPARLHGKYN